MKYQCVRMINNVRYADDVNLIGELIGRHCRTVIYLFTEGYGKMSIRS